MILTIRFDVNSTSTVNQQKICHRKYMCEDFSQPRNVTYMVGSNIFDVKKTNRNHSVELLFLHDSYQN